MAIDVLAFGAGAAANAAGNLISERVSPDRTENLLQQIVLGLENIHKAISRSSHTDIVVVIGPSPQEYVIPDYGRDHLSILVPSQTTAGTNIVSASLIFNIPGIGNHTEQVFIGWTQLDLPAYTRIWTNDSNTYNCILSFRDHPIGDSL